MLSRRAADERPTHSDTMAQGIADVLTLHPSIHAGPLEARVADRHSNLSLIGNTPLLRIAGHPSASAKVEIFGKAEWFNPGGSVKDRPVLNMLLDAERNGLLLPSRTLIDATSGNTGIAYAMVAGAIGYRVALAMPANASLERIRILEAYGAELMLTDPLAGTDGAQEVVRDLVRSHPGRYFYPDQYNNPANWKAHYESTAREIWRQTSGRVTHFVAGLGTSGTFVGTARRLKELNPAIRCISVGPDSPLHGLEGLKHLPTAVVPGIFDRSIVDEHREVETEQAYRVVRQLAKKEGLFVGVSSGAVLSACFELAKQMESGVIVTVLPDGGMKYAGERFWKEEKRR